MSDIPKTDSREVRQVEKQLAEARAEIEKFNNLFTNGIECFMTPCEKHSGENTPPFDEFMEKYGRKCTPCLVEELSAAKAKLRELRKKINEKKKMNSDRIEEIQKTTAYPESHSTLALAKVWNERAQENNKQINEMREIIKAAAFMAGKNWLHVQVALVEYLARGRGENVKWLLSEYAKFKESEE